MRYVVQKAPGIDGPPIPKDEPCLVIRAQDMLAEAMLQYYLDLSKHFPISPEVNLELNWHMDLLRQWREEHPHKLKFADR